MTQTNAEPLTFMSFHAHPDDEVFSTGGTLARLAAEGVRTILVTSNLGENGEIVNPDLDEAAKQAMFPRLGDVRFAELQASVAALGIQHLEILGFRDSGMAGTPENDHPDSFYRAPLDQAVKRLVKLIRQYRPQVITCYDPFGGYGHPDHIQAHRVAVIAFDAAGDDRFFPELDLAAWQPLKLYYSVIPRGAFLKAAEQMRARGIAGPWNNPELDLSTWGTPDEQLTTVCDVTGYLDHKVNAFRAHQTQIAPDNFAFTLPPDLRTQALGQEWYVLAKNYVPGYVPESQEYDLFNGLR